MTTATVRIPAAKRDLLRVIARTEETTMKEVLCELIDECVERYEESRDLVSRPEWAKAITRGTQEIADDVPGKSIDELPD